MRMYTHIIHEGKGWATVGVSGVSQPGEVGVSLATG